MTEPVPANTGPLTPKQILSPEQLRRLNERSDARGLLQLSLHLSVMAISGGLYLSQGDRPWLALPALVIYGFSLATMFAVVHECSHRTAFRSQGLNDAVSWLAGLLSGYNSSFYRRYHKWHHRYTQIPGRDPELEDPKPTTVGEYLRELSGLNWWLGKLQGHSRVARGRLEQCPYIPPEARDEVVRSTRIQLGVYGLGLLIPALLGHPLWLLQVWLLPLAVGQPLLRAILLAEHGDCSRDANPLTNTRTTLTTWPVHLLMWNMPFHAEHHLYPSLPFHRLADAHALLAEHFTHVDPGYISVNRQFLTQLRRGEAIA